MQDPSKTQVHTGPVPIGKEDEQLPFPEDNHPLSRISDQLHRINRTYSGTIDEVLLIDELGYSSCEKEQASLFFDLMRRRHRRRTTIINTQLGFDEWGGFLKDSHLTAALLDRITVNCTVFNMKDCISIRPKKIVYATSKQTTQDPDKSLDGQYVDE